MLGKRLAAFTAVYVAASLYTASGSASGIGLVVAGVSAIPAVPGHGVALSWLARRRARVSGTAGTMSSLLAAIGSTAVLWPGDPRLFGVIDRLPWPTVLLVLHFTAVTAGITFGMDIAVRALTTPRRD